VIATILKVMGRRGPKCGAPKSKGGKCKNRVKKPGDRCRFHPHGTSAPPPRSRRRRSAAGRQSRGRTTSHFAMSQPESPVPPPHVRRASIDHAERQLVDQAVKLCADVIEQGVLNVVPTRAAQYASEQTWDRVVRHWRGRNCTEIAQLARAILTGKDKLHAGVGWLVGWFVSLMSGSLLARRLAEEMASRVPLPGIDEQATMAARGLQLCGMFLCVAQDRELSSCACFVDVVKSEGTEQVNDLVRSAAADWVNLHVLELPVGRTAT
jgi:hypothetical protein